MDCSISVNGNIVPAKYHSIRVPATCWGLIMLPGAELSRYASVLETSSPPDPIVQNVWSRIKTAARSAILKYCLAHSLNYAPFLYEFLISSDLGIMII